MLKRDMIKAFAKLEGVDLTPHRNVQLFKCNDGDVSINGVQHKVYDPMLDCALLMNAMLSYRVSINHEHGFVFINSAFDYSASYYLDSDGSLKAGGVGAAIIECILKYNNLWSN